ncbi:MAG: arylsulfatase A-like enzyme [Candidatus Omnitrophota bacterium]|jgi:arylsulfatase A-like enzyme
MRIGSLKIDRMNALLLFSLNAIHLVVVLMMVSASLMAAEPPNIILCMADDMGWGDPGYNSATVTLADGVTPHPDRGWISTPVLDEMASTGIRFDRFYAASAVCSPTRASCLTGRNPFRVGVPTANAGALGRDESPLSDVLSNLGYRCGHFGKWHLGVMTTLRNDANRGGPGAGAIYSAPWHHAYDACFVTESKVPTYHPYRIANNSASLPVDFADSNFYGTHYWRFPLDPLTAGEGAPVPVNEINRPGDGDDSKRIMDESLAFIRSAVSNDVPFFTVIWFHTPHKPLVDPDGLSGVDSSDACRDAIEAMDAEMGRLRTELDTLGVRTNTMVWFTSDNGPEDDVDAPNESDLVRSIRSGGYRARKRSLHEGGLRVPGILEWPAMIPTGFATAFPSSTSDYYPTILDFLEVAVPEQKPLDGISLRPVIEGASVTRTTPIGFLFDGDRSWVNDTYKLINTGSGWQLYDLINDASETNALATAATIATASPGIQLVYSNLLAEFTQWNDSVNTDTPYVSTNTPTVLLTGPTINTSGTFTMTATFSEPVTQFHPQEIAVVNGAVSKFQGGGALYTFEVTPRGGAVQVQLPQGVAIDAEGNLNAPSNLLEVLSGFPTVLITNRLLYAQTVDIQNDVPGEDDNNLDKFTQGTINGGVANPFTTKLYLRGSNTVDDRKVRAHVFFDVETLPELPLVQARVVFHGHSLNVIPANDLELQVHALAASWFPTNAPFPSFNHLTTGMSASGGSITTGLDAEQTREYLIDVTAIVQAWLDGAPNHGLQLRFDRNAVNNGVGIQTHGVGAIRLETEWETFGFDVTGFDSPAGDLFLSWDSIPGLVYRIESGSRPGSYDTSVIVTGGVGQASTYIDRGILRSTNRFRVYRIEIP